MRLTLLHESLQQPQGLSQPHLTGERTEAQKSHGSNSRTGFKPGVRALSAHGRLPAAGRVGGGPDFINRGWGRGLKV